MDLRDELQRVRAGIEDFWKLLEPRLAAAKDQVALLGPAPAAGQPPEPEQAALNRAELNYLFGLLSANRPPPRFAEQRDELAASDYWQLPGVSQGSAASTLWRWARVVARCRRPLR